MSFFAAIIYSLVLAVLRIAGHKSQAFQAVAHLWVGALVGLAISIHSWNLIGLVAVLSLVELAVFIRDRRPSK